MNKLSEDPNTNDVLKEKRGYYFEAYSEVYVHEGMLRDRVRTMAYKRAIEMNKHLFKDKIVMDVGCGTGILSMFAASAGAKTVIGVDCSEIARTAVKIVRANKFDNIHIINSKVEEIDQLPDGIEKIDIIVSEWMGVCLFHESMLSTVVYARERWLKPDGLIFPDRVVLYLAAITHKDTAERRIQGWDSRYGFKMSALKKIAHVEASTETVDDSEVVTDYAKVKEMDLMTCSSDFSFETPFTLTVNRQDYIHAFVTYFDAIFKQCHFPFVLSTAPSLTPTHWRQTVFYTDRTLHMQEGEQIGGVFALQKSKNNFRDLAIKMEVDTWGAYCKENFTNNFVLR